LQPVRNLTVTAVDLHLGWHPQGDGKWFYGLSVENGRVKDDGDFRLRTAMREIVTRFQPRLRLTPQQDVLLCDLNGQAKDDLESILDRHGVARPERVSPTRQLGMACPAIPTCGLAISESERTLPGIIDGIEAELARLGLASEPISIRMTGCPNGCARPYQSEIGIVGRSGNKYVVYIGGSPLGDRLNVELKDLVPSEEIVPTLKVVLEDFRDSRYPGENLGGYVQRVGIDRLRRLVGALRHAQSA
jgi:sulfite reductase (ferredoxin)